MANEKITELTALTATNKADLVAVVDDVAGSPITKKATLNNALGTPVDYRDFDESATPASPAAGNLRIYAGTDGKLYSVDESDNVTAIGEGALSHAMHGRMTLTSETPVTTAEVTGATSVYYSPYMGNTVRMYDSTLGAWKNLSFSELEWKATDTQTGDTTNGNAIISDLTDTSLFVVGMEVTGTGIGADAVISTIDSATQVTLDVNSTADGNDISLTFKAPASAIYDLFLELQSGAVALRRPVAWTNTTTRATALTTLDGVDVLTGDTDSIYIGTVAVTTTEGELEDSYNYRGVWNYYGQKRRPFSITDGTSHSYGTGAWRQWRATTTNKIEFICGMPAEGVVNMGASMPSEGTNAKTALNFAASAPADTIIQTEKDLGVDNSTREGMVSVINLEYHDKTGFITVYPLQYGNGLSDTFDDMVISGYILG